MEKLDGCMAPEIQKTVQELRRHSSRLLQLTYAVTLFENPEVVQLHPSKKRVINRTHDFGRKHRTAILGRKQSGGVSEKFLGSRRLKIHQLSESRIRQVVAQILFVVMKLRQILCRQINAIGFQVRRHIAN